MRARTLSLLAILLLAYPAALVYGQGSPTSTLSGTVVDTSGAVIPGANVTAKNNATGGTFEAVSSNQGTFSIPALPNGTYSVTVSLTGFKTVVLSAVTVNAATPATVRVALELGELAETILVQGESSAIVQTQSPTVSTTLNVNQISNLPLTSRSAMDFIPTLAGVNTPGGNRDSTINGLPQSAINITWDGVNVQDNHNKTTDGFFSIISPRIDAVEEVTVTTAAQGAEATGQGAVQIKFVTRSGTNNFHGSGYHSFRHDSLNANTWFRNRDGLPKANLLQNQPGARVGGPILIPGLFNGRNKAFFFVNYEDFRQPGEFTRTRTIMHPLAQQGIFQYNTASGVRQVNLLALAASNGEVSTPDPVVAKVLADIRAASSGTGTITQASDPNLQRYAFAGDTKSFNYYPTVRLDLNLTQKHRLSGTTNYQNYETNPDTLNNREVAFPGFPNTGSQTSWRVTSSASLRSAFTPNLVNEARIAYVNYEVAFSPEITAAHFVGTSAADQAGFSLNFNGACCGTQAAGLTNATRNRSPSGRQSPVREFGSTLSWIKGAHSLSFGGTFTQVRLFTWAQTVVPQINFGVDTNERAASLFINDNFPGASGPDLTNARNLYAILTGRVEAIVSPATLDERANEYRYNGSRVQRGRINELGLFVQDAWQLGPDLTFNAGLRWELQLPFMPDNDIYTTAAFADVFGVSGEGNLFSPGVMTGRETQFIQYRKGDRAYKIDYKNFAPTIGAAWRPSAEGGWLRRLLGRESVIRGGYSMAFSRNGMGDYSGIFGDNPGSQITADRSYALNNLILAGTSAPLLFRETNRLAPPVFPARPDYPLTLGKGTVQITNSVNIFDRNMRTPYAHSWTIGWQRAIGRNMFVEGRYVGTRGRHLWATINYNEINIVENGFLEEFRLAQANLQANIAAGRGSTFRYFGSGTGTHPLPIILAYFSRVPTSQAGDASRYTSPLFGNTAFINTLALNNPQPCCSTSTTTPSFAFNLYNNATRRANALTAGLAPNLFIVNPALQGGANVRTNVNHTNYDSLQIELRRRLSQGLQVTGSFVYGKAYQSVFYSLRKPLRDRLDAGEEGGVTHALKGTWVYELPFGRGRRFFSGANGLLDRLIGGWHFDGIARIQSGQMLDFGNVNLVGMTKGELVKAFKLQEYPQVFTVNAPVRLYMLPRDVVENTVRAFSVSATSVTGYGPLGPPSGRYLAPANSPDCVEVVPGFGDCGVRTLVVTGPRLVRFDLSAVKQIRIKGDVNFQIRGEFLNAFNHPYFTPVTGVGSNADNYQVTDAVSGRIIQLVSRVTW